jgi:hypothetical protein
MPWAFDTLADQVDFDIAARHQAALFAISRI